MRVSEGSKEEEVCKGKKGGMGEAIKGSFLSTPAWEIAYLCAFSLPLPLRLPFPHLSEAQFDFLPDKTTTPRARALSFSIPLLVP